MIPLYDDNPTERFPFMTIILIVINVLIFFYQISLGEQGGQRFVIELGTIPWEVSNFQNHPESVSIPPLMTLFTSMFLHGGWMHLIGNMLYLWIFGNNIEDAMGPVRFIIFYVVTGLAASGAHIFTNIDSLVPTIGASGAISGVLGAYLLLFPKAKVLTLIILGWFIRIIEIPAMIVLGLWFGLQIFNSVLSGASGGGVAWLAHIGGFIAGIVLVKLFEKSDHSQTNRMDWG
ncbi:MAG: rhomboid family intramembrane serine protease [Candidatus Cloacimonetes bacterium 4572_55]|nr:MAG: rhomboid family intramembrane serine protease [Candidatus Cloacimonetes bacterium 4572_55]